jgi:hypothetical protein
MYLSKVKSRVKLFDIELVIDSIDLVQVRSRLPDLQGARINSLHPPAPILIGLRLPVCSPHESAPACLQPT